MMAARLTTLSHVKVDYHRMGNIYGGTLGICNTNNLLASITFVDEPKVDSDPYRGIGSGGNHL